MEDAEFAEKLGKISLPSWPQDDTVKEVFHYCDATGLYGILTSKCLWASDIFSLNDASEVEYAMKLVADVSKEYPAVAPIVEKILDGTLMEMYRSWDVHVCCFSSDEDSLSQWRAYGSGGHGFAIGLNRELLEEEARSRNDFTVVPILYSKEKQRTLVKEFWEGVSSLLTTFTPRTKSIAAILSRLVTLMIPLKHPAFADEHEWRIFTIRVDPTAPLFRPIRGAIVPYSRIGLKDEHFTRIVQGPTVHKKVGERSIKSFLIQNGLGHVDVQSSEIPLRSL